MPTVTPPGTTLQDIQTKVRRLTRSPSEALLSTSDLQNYINTFVVYDFPEHLRTFNFRTKYSFFTNPYQDEYPTDIASFGTNVQAANNPLYDFQNKYISVHPPVYVSGFNTTYCQNQEELFSVYPKINFYQMTGFTGDGVTTEYTGVVNSQGSQFPPTPPPQVGLLQGQVLFDTADANFNGISLTDIAVINSATGNKTVIGNLYDPNSQAYNDIITGAVPPPSVPFTAPFSPGTGVVNYATGAYTANFSAPPGPNQVINSQTIQSTLMRPLIVMYYANKFVMRPVPDQVYRVEIEVYQRPTYLMSTAANPALNEYWQYIAYGAAKKIFEDRMDLESVALIRPEFEMQQRLVERRNLVQYTNERVPTIYQDNASTNRGTSGWGWW